MLKEETTPNQADGPNRSTRDLTRATVRKQLEGGPASQAEFLLTLQDETDILQQKYSNILKGEASNPEDVKKRECAEEAANILKRLQRSVSTLVQRNIDETPMLHDTYFQGRLKLHRAFLGLVGTAQFASPEALDSFLAPKYSQLLTCQHVNAKKACAKPLQHPNAGGVFDSILSFGNPAPPPSRPFHCTVCFVSLCQAHAARRVTIDRLRPHMLAAPNFDVTVCAACYSDVTTLGVPKIVVSQQYMNETIFGISATYIEFLQRKEELEMLEVKTVELVEESRRFLSVVEHAFMTSEANESVAKKENLLLVQVLGDAFMFDGESLFHSSKRTKLDFDPYAACNHLKYSSLGRIDAVLFLVRKNRKEEAKEAGPAQAKLSRCAIKVVVPKSAAAIYVPWYSITKLPPGYYLEMGFESRAKNIISYAETKLTIRVCPFVPIIFDLPGANTNANTNTATSTNASSNTNTNANVAIAGNESVLTSISSVPTMPLPVRACLFSAATGNMALCFPQYVPKPDINSLGSWWTSINTPLATVSLIRANEGMLWFLVCLA
jgi:hypothetical protein